MLLPSDNVLTGVHGEFQRCRGWAYRLTMLSMGFARLAENTIRDVRGKGENDKLGAMDKILASSIGGALATWNQPIEVVRVEMQSMAKATENVNRPQKLTVFNTLAFIYKENGLKGLYRGVTPRIGLGIWQTVCMVSFADYVKAWYVLCISLCFVSDIYRLQGQGASIDIRYRRIMFDIHRVWT